MKRITIILIFIMLFQLCWAETSDDLVNNYVQYFKKGDLETKIEIIETAIKLEDVNFGPLYKEVLDFILNDPDVVKMNPSMGRILIYSLNEIEAWKYKEARISVLKTFESITTSTIRIAALNALIAVGKEDTAIIKGLNDWLNSQNTLFLSLLKPDYHVVDICIQTLGKFGDPSSFPYLFTAMIISYSDQITESAHESLFLISGDIKDHLLKIIEKGNLLNKYEALKFSINEKKLPENSKKELITNSLRVAYEIDSPPSTELVTLQKMRYLAIRAITPYKVGEMTPVVIRHFKLIKVEYDKGRENNANMIEALDCLGSMGTHEAAVTCADYLTYINLYTEKKKVFNEQIVLVLINNLDILGDKVAIDALQYTVFLDYNDKIKKAAQETANKLMKK
ncbi:MAG: hypothetical protein JXJ04_08500 [Spirochaetales bacterium]|nr:hypothetical protein [Spirochaetales bacterium]